jgi:hypothetical protein
MTNPAMTHQAGFTDLMIWGSGDSTEPDDGARS